MPVNDRYPIAEVIDACLENAEARNQMVFVEYVMLDGVNDGPEQAEGLIRLLDPHRFKLNLIPYNPTGSYDGSPRERIDAFQRQLELGGLTATVRLTRGQDIDAACGQLAARRAG